MFFIQKKKESFVRKKKVLSFFFDISQAFDKVWHEGLIYKLIEHNLPVYLIKWIHFYLEDRIFCVRIITASSKYKKIECGVPQGAVLSPTLFSLYINDIPTIFDKKKGYSLLFADVLVTFSIFKKPGHINTKVKDYLKKLETWLNK